MSLTWVLGHLLSVVSGLSLGLLGGGGSLLMVPILLYVFELPHRSAIALSLALVGLMSLPGVFTYWRRSQIHWKALLLFGPFAMLGTYAGAKLTTVLDLSRAFQLNLFCLFVAIAAWFMIRPDRHSNDSQVHPPRATLLPGTGFTVGALSGIVGMGGGFAIVPALVLLAGVPMSYAVGTSLTVICLKSGAGFFGYIQDLIIPWNLAISLGFSAMLGVLLGTLIAKKVPAHRLKRVFGIFLLIVGSFIFIKG